MLTLTFNLDKITKGTHRFAEPPNGTVRPAVGSLYITKDSLAKHNLTSCKRLKVTIVADDVSADEVGA